MRKTSNERVRKRGTVRKIGKKSEKQGDKENER